MNRSGIYKKTPFAPDPVYGCYHVSKLINKIMIEGKKAKAAKIVYKALEKLEKLFDKNGSEVLILAIEKIKPAKQLRSVRIASRTYRIPITSSSERAFKKAIQWIVKGSRKSKEYDSKTKEITMVNNLAKELTMLIQGDRCESYKLFEDHNRIAKENEVFVHYV